MLPAPYPQHRFLACSRPICPALYLSSGALCQVEALQKSLAAAQHAAEVKDAEHRRTLRTLENKMAQSNTQHEEELQTAKARSDDEELAALNSQLRRTMAQLQEATERDSKRLVLSTRLADLLADAWRRYASDKVAPDTSEVVRKLVTGVVSRLGLPVEKQTIGAQLEQAPRPSSGQLKDFEFLCTWFTQAPLQQRPTNRHPPNAMLFSIPTECHSMLAVSSGSESERSRHACPHKAREWGLAGCLLLGEGVAKGHRSQSGGRCLYVCHRQGQVHCGGGECGQEHLDEGQCRDTDSLTHSLTA